MKINEELLAFIDKLQIVDTHEHLPAEADRPKDSDVLCEWLTHYFSSDLVSAGMSHRDLHIVIDSSKDLTKRWKLAEPYWEAARNTGYGRSLDISARGIYGIDGVNRKTIGPLNEAFIAARQKGGHYQRVLRDLSRIAVSIVDDAGPCDTKFFVTTLHVDPMVLPAHRRDLVALGQEVGVRIHDLEDYREAVRRKMDAAMKRPEVVTLKVGLAYDRSLFFAKTTAAAAESDFNELFANENSPEDHKSIKIGRAFQDYMMHYILKLADERGLAVQIHTGIQEGTGNVVEDSNPLKLTNLFLEYKNIKFDIFHMGYPYMLELSSLAKNFRNVFIDMCWGHIISPVSARRALVEWLDTTPANKISAFGGDYCFVDGVYGHQRIARENVAAALTEKIADGVFDLDRAKQLAQWMFVDNPSRLFGLAARLKQAGKSKSGKKNVRKTTRRDR